MMRYAVLAVTLIMCLGTVSYGASLFFEDNDKAGLVLIGVGFCTWASAVALSA